MLLLARNVYVLTLIIAAIVFTGAFIVPTSPVWANPGTPDLSEAKILRDTPPEDLFALRLIVPERDVFQPHVEVIVQAYNPYTLGPIVDLPVTLDVSWEGEERPWGETDQHELRTGLDGTASQPISLPAALEVIHLDLEATATYRGHARNVETSVYFYDLTPRPLVSTDRQLYQPGQTVHIRGLWLDLLRRPMANETVALTLQDGQGRRVARVERTTTDLGIASFDWPIPQSVKPGDYVILTDLDRGGSTRTPFSVRPYEPSTLWLEAHPKQSVLIPGDHAIVDVIARYANGDPLVNAEVRLIYEPRKRSIGAASSASSSETQTESPVTQRTDARGRATVRLDLTQAFEDVSPYLHFTDLPFRLEARDPLTLRSESTGFELRLSRQKVHLYSVGSIGNGIPHETFVVAQWANGDPFSGWVSVEGAYFHEEERPVGRVRTDAYGVASTSHLNLDPFNFYELRAYTEDDPDIRIGQSEAAWRVQDDLRLHIQRPLLEIGESLGIDLHVARPTSDLRVLVFDHQGRLLTGEQLPKVESSATVTFPYQEHFEGPLSILALSLSPEFKNHRDLPAARRWAIYPEAPERHLQLEMSARKSTYRPGETAQLDLAMHAARGGGSVAVAMVDRATEARQASLDMVSGAALLAPLDIDHGMSGPFDARLGAWDLDRLLHLPKAQRRGQAAQRMARALLADYEQVFPNVDVSDPLHHQRGLFALLVPNHDEISDVMRRLQRRPPEHVVDAPSFRQALMKRGIDLDALRDPWDHPYRIQRSIRRNQFRFEILSNGRDGQPQTLDDFVMWSAQWDFARRLGDALKTFAKWRPSQAHDVLSHPRLRDAAMAKQGIVWEEQRDPWGHPYDLRWSLAGRKVRYQLISRGPDGLWQHEIQESPSPPSDDLVAWNFSFPFATALVGQLRTALLDSAWNDAFPSTDAEFRQHLQRQGVDLEDWRDPWGHPLYFKFEITTAGTDAKLDAQIFDIVQLWSAGVDGARHTADDQELAHIQHPRDGYRTYFQQLGYPHLGPAEDTSTGLPEGYGSLVGIVILDDGFPVPGVLVTVAGDPLRRTLSDEDGSFQLNVPAGTYTVTAELEGFTTLQFVDIQILPGQQFHLPLRLELDTFEEIIVTGELRSAIPRAAGIEPPKPVLQRSTPRLRKDFPETLFWLADGRFDEDGRLRLDVPLADNLTRWHVAALASDAEGRLASAELDLTVTQPFFLLPELPSHLTLGDVLQVPLDVHNRTGGEVSVQLDVAEVTTTEDGLSKAGTARSQALDAKEGIRRVVTEQTFERVGTQTLRWTASPISAPGVTENPRAADAIQKSADVSWNGARHVTTQSQLLQGDAVMEILLPEGALPGSGTVEVLIYDNLESHVVDALRGLAKKPTGCAEQTTSSAWIHVLLLDRWSRTGQDDSEPANASRKHAQNALASLATFRVGNGFGYWSHSREADLALTAYVLEFLMAAAEHLSVDEELIDAAAAFLRAQQAANGRWPSPIGQKQTEAGRLLHLRTEAFALRALALHGVQRGHLASRKAALSSLQGLHGDVDDDPYSLALLTQTASALLGQPSEARQDSDTSAEVTEMAIDTGRRLVNLAQSSEGDLTWHLRSQSPFYGWGRSGRLSTTALAVQALAALHGTDLIQNGDPFGQTLQAALGGGLSHLLLNKEADGTWFTTQASVHSLRALSTVLGDGTVRTTASGATPNLDGQPMAERVGPSTVSGPRRWTQDLSQNRHELTLREEPTSPQNFSLRLVQTRVTSYLPWSDPRATPRSRDLAFDVQCADTAPLERGQTVQCEVEMGRVGSRANGMLIAEVGLPPGAEVDEAALRKARRDRQIDDFEVWPGRLVLYAWPAPQNPTVRLTISWRPRLAMRAATQPSLLYDYYNPDARIVLPPRQVVVTERMGFAALR